ncbi:nucleotide sugar dehydrogenase [Pajaroellobacter abortibovis]|uniref:UDP-N-acetyl-D-glucosamine dehydrogenase n=1 Tax=Pajaroellobacter abortibovis TaxID=1882918 RepID=A0A1L6MX91_9BACT|nr:nucleotide sugar dehydrogenase [Pajaroellobacter abortibovis]APS00069.1 UDP-N-acetyl-D-glucosamine dehydrogenase [Pajaroellobacter abortibovis]
MLNSLLHKIHQKKIHLVIVGGGYVGLPLAVGFALAGFRVTILDHDAHKMEAIQEGHSYIEDVCTQDIQTVREKGLLGASTSEEVLGTADCIILCIPTPLKKNKDPDLSHLDQAVEAILPFQQAGMLVVLESTSYPGTTREHLVHKLIQNGKYTVGQDLFIAFSPERVDPGNSRFKIANTPKVIGAVTPACMTLAQALYSHAIDTIVPVSSPDAAEMIKIVENTFRAVNIGLVNEFALLCESLNLDIWEIIRAASTKPFGYMPFYPGPGLGGHCIPIDPLYLNWKMRTLRRKTHFIELADSVNGAMPHHVIQLVVDGLNQEKKSVHSASILVAGVAYKADIGDVRESPALEIIHTLKQKGARVRYLDPEVPSFNEEGLNMKSVDPETNFGEYDMVIIVTNHTRLALERMVKEAKLIVDTRDATRPYRNQSRGRIICLGEGTSA